MCGLHGLGAGLGMGLRFSARTTWDMRGIKSTHKDEGAGDHKLL